MRTFLVVGSFALAAISVLHGCANVDKPCQPKTIAVERVFWHQWNDYSFMVKGNDGKMRITRYQISGKYGNSPVDVTLIADVPKDETMRIELSQCVHEHNITRYEKAVIHIHAPEDVGGGDWKQGKSGTGKTIPIN